MIFSDLTSSPTRGIIFSLCFFHLVFMLGCSANSTPEEIVDHFISSAVEAAEQRNSRTLRDLISESYTDPAARTKKDLSSYIAGYFLRNKSLYIFTHISGIETKPDGSLEITCLAALAGKPIDNISILPSLNAECYWFNLGIAEEDGEWKLIFATWKKAMLNDFFKE